MMSTETTLPTLEEHGCANVRPSQGKHGEDISILDILIILAGRKWLVMKVMAAFAVLSIAVSLLLPKRYTATVLLLPPRQSSSLGAELVSQMGSLGGMAALAAGGGAGFLKNPNDMYVAMFKSRTVEDAMIRKFGLMQEYHQRYLSSTRKVFEKYSRVDGSGKDGLIRISVEDGEPRRAAALANGYVDEFRDLSEHLAVTEAGQRRLFFQQQMEHAKENLANAEVALAQTEQKTGIMQLDSQARALIESAASLRAEINAKEIQIQGMETYATGENAQLIQAKQELDGLRAQLARLGGSAEIPGSSILPAKGQMTEAGVEYVRKLRDLKYDETIFDILARQFEVAKLDEAKEGALVQVVDPALPPDHRSFPNRTLIVLVTTLTGLLVGVFAAILTASWERMQGDPTVSSKFKKFYYAISHK